MAKKRKPGKAAPLTDRMRRFAEEYLIDCNASAAARRAGYTTKNSDQLGHRLLKNPKIATVIAERKEERSRKVGISQDRVLKETEVLAFSNVDDYMMDPDTGRLVLAPGAPAEAMRAVSSVKYGSTTTRRGDATEVEHWCEFRLWDKPGMVKLAGKHVDTHGFTDRMEVTGKDGGPLEFTLQLDEGGE
jgi:phage terminase small subunit